MEPGGKPVCLQESSLQEPPPPPQSELLTRRKCLQHFYMALNQLLTECLWSMHFQNEVNCSLLYVYIDFMVNSKRAQSEVIQTLLCALFLFWCLRNLGQKDILKLATQSFGGAWWFSCTSNEEENTTSVCQVALNYFGAKTVGGRKSNWSSIFRCLCYWVARVQDSE